MERNCEVFVGDPGRWVLKEMDPSTRNGETDIFAIQYNAPCINPQASYLPYSPKLYLSFGLSHLHTELFTHVRDISFEDEFLITHSSEFSEGSIFKVNK